MPQYSGSHPQSKKLSWDDVFGSHRPRERLVDPGDQRWRSPLRDRQAANPPEYPPQVADQQNNSSTLGHRYGLRQLLEAYRSNAPGGWSDNRWEQSKHFVGIPYIAIMAKVRQALQSEFQVYEQDEKHADGKKAVDCDDDLVQLLKRPNNDDTFGVLLANWVLQLNLTGLSLTWEVPNRRGEPCELYSVPTALAVPMPVLTPDYPQGAYRIQPVYPYGPFSSYPTPYSAVGATVPAQWMIRMKYPHPLLRYDGYSPLTATRLQLDSMEAIDRSRWYAMQRGIDPSAVINFDAEAETPPPDEIDRIRADFEALLQGPENAGRVLIATPGASVEPWSGKPAEMGWDQSWTQLAEFALAVWGVTKPVAGMIDESSYATLYAALKQFHIMSLQPDFDLIAGYLTKHLAPHFARGRHLLIEIRCPRIDDHELKNQKSSTLISGKCWTKNELRVEYGLKPTKEKWGEDIAGTDSQPAGQQGQPQQGQGGDQPQPEPPIGQGGGPPNQPAGGAGNDRQQQREEMRPEPAEVSSTRPRPGNLGTGSLGPRKGLFLPNGITYKNGLITKEK